MITRGLCQCSARPLDDGGQETDRPEINDTRKANASNALGAVLEDPENGVVGMSEPGSLAHCVDDNCNVNGNSCSRAGHVHQESPAASLLNGGDTVSA